MSNFEGKYHYALKQRAFAWAKYYEALNDRRDEAEVIINMLEKSMGSKLNKNDKDVVLPEHITKEFYDMGLKLKKDFSCPVCLDIPDRSDFVITKCGHSYCKSCLDTIKKQDDAKCALCRSKLY